MQTPEGQTGPSAAAERISAAEDALHHHRGGALLAAWEREMRKVQRTVLPEPTRQREQSRGVVDLLVQELDGHGRVEDVSDRGFDLCAMVLDYSALRRASIEILIGEKEAARIAQVHAHIDAELLGKLRHFLESREEALNALHLARTRFNEDAAPILRVLLDACESVDSASLFVPHGDGCRLASTVGAGLNEPPVASGSAVERSLRSGAPVERRLTGGPQSDWVPSGTKAIYCVPLRHGDQVLGVLQVASKSQSAFGKEDRFFFWRVEETLSGALGYAQQQRLQAEAQRQLEQALARVDSLLAASPCGIAFLDTELNFLRVNGTLAQLTNTSLESMVGRNVQEVTAPALLEKVLPIMREVLQTRERANRVQLTVHGPRRYAADFYPVITREQELLGLGVMVVDETEWLTEEDSLRELLQLRETFVGIVSHDLRNPLQNVLVGLERLSLADLTPNLLQTLRRAQRNARRMEHMIRDLQELTRAQRAGGITIRPEWMDLTVLSETVIDEMRSLYPTVSFELSGIGDTRGEWDGERLTQLLVNLLSNATDYAPVDAPVAVSVEGLKDRVRLHVENHGEAINEKQLKVLFDPFQRSSRSGMRGRGAGLGLGLYIVKQIANAHGANVGVSCPPGKVRFTVDFPRRSAAQ
ncbi:MAG: ATP-binding protein [Myxococcaceae bacterium]